MRVLWFTNTASCYSENGKEGAKGGGWISSLEGELKKNPEIQLGICFYYNKTGKEFLNGVTYYPLQRPRKTIFYSLKQVFSDKETASYKHEHIAVHDLIEIVKDFKPDIIQVFGSENIYGLLAYHVDVPLLLHIQGVLSVYYNSFLPPGISWGDYLFEDLNLKHIISRFSNKLAWARNVLSEQRMFKKIKYVTGRTEWDREVVMALGATVQPAYFHCDEILREAFYVNKKRTCSDKIIFVTIISAFLYKGYDVLLKTANILKNTMCLDFEWRVYGYVDTVLAHKKSGLNPNNLNVKFMGLADAEELQEVLLIATAYIHASYIENSPNVIGEAQMLGCPCVACNVGGISSLITNGVSGILVPSNDIYQLSYKIFTLAKNPKYREELGRAGQLVARKRHDKVCIANRVLEIYNNILDSEKNNNAEK